ncbi:MAG: hypothetical protein K0R73_1187, partial [Candidatus Midichloriaceae bacterium]|nr:hypothetical protein [Candidatus Midichloriaceae bacterium]
MRNEKDWQGYGGSLYLLPRKTRQIEKIFNPQLCNAFNRCAGLGYWYQDSDITAIAKLLLKDFENIELIEAIGRSQYQSVDAKEILKNKKEKLETGKKLIGIYNTEGKHWIAFIIFNGAAGKITCVYKDSLGEKRDDFESDIKQAFGEETSISCLAEGQAEQTEELDNAIADNKGLVSCGIFALKNLGILTSCANFGEAEFYNPGKNLEEYECNIRAARREYGLLYARSTYDSLQESEIRLKDLFIELKITSEQKKDDELLKDLSEALCIDLEEVRKALVVGEKLEDVNSSGKPSEAGGNSDTATQDNAGKSSGAPLKAQEPDKEILDERLVRADALPFKDEDGQLKAALKGLLEVSKEVHPRITIGLLRIIHTLQVHWEMPELTEEVNAAFMKCNRLIYNYRVSNKDKKSSSVEGLIEDRVDFLEAAEEKAKIIESPLLSEKNKEWLPDFPAFVNQDEEGANDPKSRKSEKRKKVLAHDKIKQLSGKSYDNGLLTYADILTKEKAYIDAVKCCDLLRYRKEKGSEEYREAEKKLHEVEARLILDLLNCPGNLDTRELGSREKEGATYGSNKQLISKLERIGDMFLQAGKYRAATNLYHELLSIIQKLQEDGEYKYNAQLRQSEKFIPRELFTIEKRVFIKFAGACRGERKLENLDKHKVKLEDIRRKQSLSLSTEHNLLKVQQEWNSSFAELLKDIVREAEVQLGEGYECAIVSIGSLARGEASLYSDIDLMIILKDEIVDNNACEKYFRALIDLIKIKIISLGEMPSLPDSIDEQGLSEAEKNKKLHYDKAGFFPEIKGSGLEKYNLIRILREGGLPAEKCLAEMLSLDPQEETRKLLESYKDAFKGKINRYKEQLLKEIQETSFKFFPTNIEKVKELLIESLNSDKLKDKKDYHAVIQAILSLHPEEETKKFLKAHEEVLEGKIKEDKGQLLEEMKEKSFRFFHTSIGPVEELLLENDKLKDKWEYHAAIQDVLLLNSGKEAQELLSQYHDVLTKRNKIARGRITNQLELAAFKLELGEGCKGINIKNDILRYPMLLVNRLFAYYDLKLEKISEDQTITEQKIDALVAESKKRKIDLEKLEGWEDFLLYCFSKERAKGLKKWLKLGHELRIKAHYLHESSQDSSEKVFVDEEAGVIYLENEDGRRDVCTLEKLQKLHAKQMQPLYRLVELWGKLIGVKSEERLSTILREESVELLQEYERSGNIEYANQANWYYEKAVGFDLDGSERDWRKSIEELCDKNGKAGHKLSFLNHQGVLRTWSLKEEVEKQLLDLNNHEIDGRRPTVKLKVNGHYFHIKKCPEAPGTEYAVSSLSHLLFGYTTAHFSMLAAVMNRENKMFPVLISRTVIGTKLDCETEDTLKDIDSESFGLSFIRTILTNPGDDQGANHVVQATRDPIGKVKRRLICIDGDHGLLEESITGDVCLLKSIVYCAQQMQEKIPDEVKERVSKINPEILIAWLTKIISMDEYNRNLNKVMYDHDKKFGMLNRWFTSEESYLIKVHEIEKHGEKEEVTVTIPILFNENIVNNVCYKLMQLQDLFGAGAESNYFRVLRMMYLQVANHYEKAFLEPKNNTPGKRFKSISKGQYEERTAPPVISIDESGVVKKTQVKYSTTKTRYYASLAEKINAKQFGQQIYTPIQAFDKLNSLIITINDLPKIREQIIEEGIIDAELPLEIRQMVINGRESMGSGPFVNNIFKAIAKKHADDEEEIKAKQRKVLELIKAHFSGVNYYAKFTREFKRINLSNCVELKDKDLNKILSERTEWLDITGCNQLTIAALSIIAKKCKKLETLYVSHDIKDIGWLKGTKFKVLRKLSIIDCKKITNQWDKVIEACQNLQQLHLTDQGFIEVVKTGNLNLVKITNCRNINAQDKDGKTPLHWVAANGHKEIVELLLANKANIEAVANNGGTPLMFAAHNGHKEIVELLLANKANIEAKDKEGNTSLHYAVSNGHEEIVELLLEKDADIKIENMKGFVALDLAFRYLGSNIETIKLLCEQDPNAIGKDEKTPLMWAVMNEKEELVDFLLKKGADVEAKDNKGNTALDLAFSSQNSNIKIITLLCEKDPNAIGKDGNTALDLAFSFRGSNIETIKLLCEQDPNAIGKDGRTPLMWAVIR